MTSASDLVLDGGEVKLRLKAERNRSGSVVHVDWLRFTSIRRNVVPTFAPSPVSDLACFPEVGTQAFNDLPPHIREAKIRYTAKNFEYDNSGNLDLDAFVQSYEMAMDVCGILGSDFGISGDLKKGVDFYKHRWSIERNGVEVAWVGFLATSDSPRQAAQAQTIHTNIEGTACTFARPGWRDRMADLIDLHEAKITRADLALDFFDGVGYDIAELLNQYKNAEFDVRGKRPGCRVAGDWANGAERSLYVGCRKSGKETNCYEKGDQLFGRLANDPWIRYELRYGNKLRVLPSDILRRPADFFAGASNWHALQILAASGAWNEGQKVPQDDKLPQQTVLAEVHRNIRWALSSAAPTIAAAFRYLPESSFLELCNWETKNLPGRLRKFSPTELTAAFSRVMGTFSTVGGTSPALA